MGKEVPVIDIRALRDGAKAHQDLDLACREWGFFQILGHELDSDLIDALTGRMHDFFALSSVRKRAVMRSAENAWGFYDRELTKNERDWKEIFDVGPAETVGPLAGAKPQWPDLPDFRDALGRYMAGCERVARTLLESIGRNLGAPEGALDAAFSERHSSFLRLNYYPICAAPDRHLGIHHHTDAGALTVLWQDPVAGLQVLRGERWHVVEPIADALVINIGDIVQVWSNDRYMAPVHRVAASATAERYSAPYFFNPDYAADYMPLPSVCSDADPARYRRINWGEFRAGRAAGDYADAGEEIQVAQFRLD